jgi:hypothetical protein
LFFCFKNFFLKKRPRAFMEAVKTVFLCDEHRPWQVERAEQLVRDGLIARVCEEMCRDVNVVVATSKWVSLRRSVECLFVLARSAHVQVVSFDWILACLESGSLVGMSRYVIVDASLDAAKRGAHRLLENITVVVSRQMPQQCVVNIPVPGTPEPLRSRSSGGTSKICVTYSDATLLALLHGARVVDGLNLPIPSHRGFSQADVGFQEPAPPLRGEKRGLVCVLVPNTDSVSSLGLDIYSSVSLRPVLIEWLISCIQKQSLLSTDRFEVYAS